MISGRKSECRPSWIGGFAWKSGLSGHFSPWFGGLICWIERNDVGSIRQLAPLPSIFLASAAVELDRAAIDPSQNSQFLGISTVEGR
ncbi:hypothetical protein CCGE531_34065 (plasmid) [Rhizobium sp. CCGE531]|nr:hypothetical protein CCGE531_34065 [Rhizobium sp. CCGE531]AYG77314.1 hypothetical protein CCGE532_33205 [Rhizobium sp. CCGE532]